MTIQSYVGTIVYFFLSVASAQKNIPFMQDSTSTVDTTLAVAYDVTRDGKIDTIYCHLSAENWKTPIHITYTVVSNGKKILKESYVNDTFDEDFGNVEVDTACNQGYLICKKRWYVQVLPARLIKLIKTGDERRAGLFDTTSDFSIPSTLMQFYKDSLRIEKNLAANQVKKLVNDLSKKPFVLVEIPVIPIYDSFPRIFDPHTNSFVMIMGF